MAAKGEGKNIAELIRKMRYTHPRILKRWNEQEETSRRKLSDQETY